MKLLLFVALLLSALLIGSVKCLQPLNDPLFVSTQEYEMTLSTETKLASVKGYVLYTSNTYKFYPLDALQFHQVINDIVDGQPRSIAYSPLTANTFAFNFSGMPGSSVVPAVVTLWSDSLVSDRVSFSDPSATLWSPMLRMGVKGARVGVNAPGDELFRIKYQQAKAIFGSRLQVLSRPSRLKFLYDQLSYTEYEATKAILFPSPYSAHQPPYVLYHPKMLTLVANVNNDLRMYPEGELEKITSICVTQGGVSVLSVHDRWSQASNSFKLEGDCGSVMVDSALSTSSGRLMLRDKATQSAINVLGLVDPSSTTGTPLTPLPNVLPVGRLQYYFSAVTRYANRPIFNMEADKGECWHVVSSQTAVAVALNDTFSHQRLDCVNVFRQTSSALSGSWSGLELGIAGLSLFGLLAVIALVIYFRFWRSKATGDNPQVAFQPLNLQDEDVTL